jgi:L-rhamnose mutarotase
MIRKAFVMPVNAGAETEHARRHQPIPSELERVLKPHGVRNYSIFLLPETRQRIACAEVEDERQWAAIATTPSASDGGDIWRSHAPQGAMPHRLQLS